ncbi:MAG: xanthine dehydrogenase family protein subunit M [Thaumarchaeota archaeon]|nr:xanthine dehydrogenase family protein subunit M [Nitrososphaerota archaeon]
MKNFQHFDAKTVDEAVTLLKRFGEKGRLIAGGTDLVGELKDYIHYTKQPEALINIKSVAGLDGIKEDGEGLKIGALARLADVADSAVVKGKWKILADAAGRVGSNQIRQMGTLGGNLTQHSRCNYYRNPRDYFNCLRKGGLVCYAIAGDNRFQSIFGGRSGCYQAHPSDTAPALMALNAKLKTSERTISIDEFFTDMWPGTVLKEGEIITEIQVPSPPAGSKQNFIKYTLRETFDFPIVDVAVLITPATGTVTDARVALGAVAPAPIRSKPAEDALKGKSLNESTADQAASAAVAGTAPLPFNKYKVQITKTLVKRAILA